MDPLVQQLMEKYQMSEELAVRVAANLMGNAGARSAYPGLDYAPPVQSPAPAPQYVGANGMPRRGEGTIDYSRIPEELQFSRDRSLAPREYMTTRYQRAGTDTLANFDRLVSGPHSGLQIDTPPARDLPDANVRAQRIQFYNAAKARAASGEASPEELAYVKRVNEAVPFHQAAAQMASPKRK
jgi:hypothetical protein